MSLLKTSWVHYEPDCHFSIQNIPFGIFSTPSNLRKRPGTIIGNQVIDLSVLAEKNLLKGDFDAKYVFSQVCFMILL